MEAQKILTKELLEEVLNSLTTKKYVVNANIDRIEKEFRDSLSGRPFETKSPSQNSTDIKAVNFRKKEPKEAVQSFFKEAETEKESRVFTADGTREGRDIHSSLAEKINSGPDSRDGNEGELLKDLEEKFGFKFLKAEVPIYAFAEKSTEKLQFWRGKIDAVGLTDDGKVVIVDWKTTNDVLHFWRSAGHYSNPIHQGLLYARSLKTHLSAHLPAEVADYGPVIMIVAIYRSDLNTRAPRLCRDLEGLRKAGFMEKLDTYTWSIKPDPDKVKPELKDGTQTEEKVEDTLQLDPSDSIFSEEILLKRELKDDTLLSDIFQKNATLGQLRQLLNVPPLEFTPKAAEGAVKPKEENCQDLQEDKCRSIPDTNIKNSNSSAHVLTPTLIPQEHNGNITFWSFPSSISQSTILGRTGSNACTFISLLFSKLFFSLKVDIPAIYTPLSQMWVNQLVVQGILLGNSIYDSVTQNDHQTFGVLDAAEKTTALLNVIGQITVEPEQPVNLTKEQGIPAANLEFHWKEALDQGQTASIFILNNNTVAFITTSQGILLFDSHLHGDDGAYVAFAKWEHSSELRAWYKSVNNFQYDLGSVTNVTFH